MVSGLSISDRPDTRLLRPVAYTNSPDRASSTAIARPAPRVAPATRATRAPADGVAPMRPVEHPPPTLPRARPPRTAARSRARCRVRLLKTENVPGAQPDGSGDAMAAIGPREQGPTGDGAARVVVVGAGFGGLAAVRQLARARARTTLIDQNIYATFQPLLYEVATAGLTSSDVAFPARSFS